MTKVKQMLKHPDKLTAAKIVTKSGPSGGGFSGIAGCTPSIANQWATTAVSTGALGKGVSIT